jgi:hypothetical protein
MAKNFHEQYVSDPGQLPSERSTGLVFTAAALVAAYVWRSNPTVLTLALVVAGGLLLVSLLAPHLLGPLNVAWFKLALLLNKIVSPVVMLAMFLLAIVPFGFIMQRRRDPLRKQPSRDAASYWIERDRNGPANNMANQF